MAFSRLVSLVVNSIPRKAEPNQIPKIEGEETGANGPRGSAPEDQPGDQHVGECCQYPNNNTIGHRSALFGGSSELP